MSNPLNLDKTKPAILIGNGPSVLSVRNGKRIDSFDEIFRFNRYKTNGFEDFVGSRTTVWCTFGRGEVPSDNVVPDKVLFTHGQQGKPSGTPSHIWRIPLSFYNNLRNKIIKDINNPNVLPTSGLLVISWLLENMYDSLTITGFDCFSKERSKQHHYWNKGPFSKPKEHNGDWELNLLRQLIKEGKLIFL